MNQTCIWCSQKIVNESDSQQQERSSAHAVCGCCAEHFTLPPSGPLQKHLDRANVPVFVIELHAGNYLITRAVNRKACDWLGKEQREIVQHLSGNVIDCAYARLPEGCGGTVFCAACGIKQAVAGTAETGEPRVKAMLTLWRGDPGHPSLSELSITTMKAGRMVLLRVDTAGADRVRRPGCEAKRISYSEP